MGYLRIRSYFRKRQERATSRSHSSLWTRI